MSVNLKVSQLNAQHALPCHLPKSKAFRPGLIRSQMSRDETIRRSCFRSNKGTDKRLFGIVLNKSVSH